MAFSFVKMHGLGNDFVVIDARAGGVPALDNDLIRALADRRRGIGCDQVILISPPEVDGAARVRFWNPDGGEAGACGNGTRCVAALLLSETGHGALRLETESGILGAAAAGDGLIVVDMGRPRLDWQDIPLAERMDTRVLDLRLGPIDAPVLIGPSAVNMGNPHCVFFVDNIAAHDLAKIGPMVEHHPLFPERANVSLAHVEGPRRIRLRVWERGAGITQACGTAACAVVVAAARKGFAERRADVVLDGGTLGVDWRESDDHVLLTGPVAVSFSGMVEPEHLLPGSLS